MSGMSYESSTIATLRRALDEVLLDGRVHGRKSTSALEIAEHLLAQAAAGERDLERGVLLGCTCDGGIPAWKRWSPILLRPERSRDRVK